MKRKSGIAESDIFEDLGSIPKKLRIDSIELYKMEEVNKYIIEAKDIKNSQTTYKGHICQEEYDTKEKIIKHIERDHLTLVLCEAVSYTHLTLPTTPYV